MSLYFTISIFLILFLTKNTMILGPTDKYCLDASKYNKFIVAHNYEFRTESLLYNNSGIEILKL